MGISGIPLLGVTFSQWIHATIQRNMLWSNPVIPNGAPLKEPLSLGSDVCPVICLTYHADDLICSEACAGAHHLSNLGLIIIIRVSSGHELIKVITYQLPLVSNVDGEPLNLQRG